MRSLAFLLLLGGCAASTAAQANTYLPPRLGGGGIGGGGYPGGVGVGGGYPGGGGVPNGYAGGGAGQGRPVGIISLVNENNGDGMYRYRYETENGIEAEEQGQVQDDGGEGVLRAQGSFSFTAPDDGQRYSLQYTADENGFQPRGDHLPTPPPIPEEILRALEQNAADEARGLSDDGQYREQQGPPLGGRAGYQY